jgi:hypothetical protein
MAGTLVIDTLNTATPTAGNPGSVLTTNNAFNGIAKAWVQFSLSGTTVTVNGSFNVGIVTRISSGTYTITFSTALSNANYSALISTSLTASNNWSYPIMFSNGSVNTAPTTSSFNVNTVSNTDNTYYCIAVFSS